MLILIKPAPVQESKALPLISVSLVAGFAFPSVEVATAEPILIEVVVSTAIVPKVTTEEYSSFNQFTSETPVLFGFQHR
jgi:hypothetical protein